MRARKLSVLAVLLLALAACAGLRGVESGDITAQAEETQSVIVPGVPTLTVNHFAGDLTIRDGAADKITAHVTRQSTLSDAAAAEASLADITVAFSQSGSDVTLDVEVPKKLTNEINDLQAIVELEVPPGTTLFLNQGGGNVVVEQPSCDVTIDAGAGDFTVTLPADAAFRLIVAGGVAKVASDFEGVPSGGLAADIDTTVGDNPTQTLTFNVGAGQVNLRHAD